MRNPDVTRHLVFIGNPGTGKTTVARMVSGHLPGPRAAHEGPPRRGRPLELVAGYLGQTAMKTAEVCANADGGVLFIDEAYSLGGDQYGSEAINTLVKEMEDHRDRPRRHRRRLPRADGRVPRARTPGWPAGSARRSSSTTTPTTSSSPSCASSRGRRLRRHPRGRAARSASILAGTARRMRLRQRPLRAQPARGGDRSARLAAPGRRGPHGAAAARAARRGLPLPGGGTRGWGTFVGW